MSDPLQELLVAHKEACAEFNAVQQLRHDRHAVLQQKTLELSTLASKDDTLELKLRSTRIKSFEAQKGITRAEAATANLLQHIATDQKAVIDFSQRFETDRLCFQKENAANQKHQQSLQERTESEISMQISINKSKAKLGKVDNEIKGLEKWLESRRDDVAAQHGIVLQSRHDILELEKKIASQGNVNDVPQLQKNIHQKKKELGDLRDGLGRMKRLITEKTAQMYM